MGGGALEGASGDPTQCATIEMIVLRRSIGFIASNFEEAGWLSGLMH